MDSTAELHNADSSSYRWCTDTSYVVAFRETEIRGRVSKQITNGSTVNPRWGEGEGEMPSGLMTQMMVLKDKKLRREINGKTERFK
jgi:hypothetical protein